MTIKITKTSIPPAPTKLAKSGPPIVQVQQPKPTTTKLVVGGMTTSITLTEVDGTSATYSLGTRDDLASALAIINLDRVQAGLAPLNIDDLGR